MKKIVRKYKHCLTHVLLKWGIVMQQPNPLQDNNNEPVANALLYDLSSIAEIGEPKSAEDYLYQQAL